MDRYDNFTRDQLLSLVRTLDADRAARQADARMAAIVESSQDAIVSRALDGTILTWNAGAERLFGYAAAEIVGRHIEVLYPAEIKPEMFRRQRMLLRGQEFPILETVRLAKDGRRIHVSTSPSLMRDAGGAVCGVSTIIRDITAQKRAEEERLAHAIGQRDALVGEVHHRIKNNLQGVIGLLRQKMRKYPAMAAEIEEAVTQLQTVAAVYGLQGTRADGLVDLRAMLEAICVSAEGLVGGRVDRAFERKSARPVCVAGTDAVSVAVALNELLFNALKHQPARAGSKRASVLLHEADGVAEIRIANRGRLSKEFDYAAGRALGTGLGLVRTLLASPGGAVEFSNGRGRVEVRLKLAPPLLAGRQQWSTRRRNDGGSGKKKAAAAHTDRG